MTRFFIGLDSIDSNYAGCTTHFTVFLIKQLNKMNLKLESPPFLVRLNPSVPHKTRGNAAVSMVFKQMNQASITPRELGEFIKNLVVEYVSINPPTERQSGIIVLDDDSFYWLRNWLTRLYEKAVYDVVPQSIVENKLLDAGHSYFNNGRGIIGAAASLGFLSKREKKITYELIAYRDPAFWGSPRKVISQSIKEACRKYYPKLFNNYDFEKDLPVSVPRGPDPVLIGLRGTDLNALLNAANEILFKEPVYAWMLYVTNQHTDEPVNNSRKIKFARLHQVVRIKGVVSVKPRVLKGGHTLAWVSDETGSIPVIAYRQSGRLRDVLSMLTIGDLVELVGAVKPSTIENAEKFISIYKLKLLEMPRSIKLMNPQCPNCGKTLKSKGKQLFMCPKCGYRVLKTSIKYRILLKERKKMLLEEWVTPPPGRLAHLIRPSGVFPTKIIEWRVTGSWLKLLESLNERTIFNPFR